MKTLLLTLLPFFGYSQVDSIPYIRLDIFLVNDSTVLIKCTKPVTVSDEAVEEILDLYYARPTKNKKRKYI